MVGGQRDRTWLESEWPHHDPPSSSSPGTVGGYWRNKSPSLTRERRSRDPQCSDPTTEDLGRPVRAHTGVGGQGRPITGVRSLPLTR